MERHGKQSGRGCVKRYWIASRIALTSWRPARNRIASAALRKNKKRESKRTGRKAVNDGPWKAWKTKPRFSTLSTALGNRSAIPISHRFDD
jgi:hypothetical protein